jgi:hypothetical protein
MAKVKVDTSKSKDPKSKRSKKRNKTGITESRANRRASKRLGSAMGAYNAGAKMDAKAFTVPGKQDKW